MSVVLAAMTSHVDSDVIAERHLTTAAVVALRLSVAAVVVVVMTTTTSGHVADCPPTCYCNAATGVVQCARRGLTAIPEVVPNGSKQMNLNGNRFRSPVIGRANFTRYPGVARKVGMVSC